MRLTKKKETQSKSCFPLVIWHTCAKCGRKFGLEKGCKTHQPYPSLHFNYLCGECSVGGDKSISDLIFKDLREAAYARVMARRPINPPGQGPPGRIPKSKQNDDNYITIKKI